jgi:hypothetical protein
MMRRAPRWPDPERPQRTHLDILVGDLDEAEQRVVAVDATWLEGGGPTLRVFAGPGGRARSARITSSRTRATAPKPPRNAPTSRPTSRPTGTAGQQWWAPPRLDAERYKHRNVVERCFNRTRPPGPAKAKGWNGGPFGWTGRGECR